MEGGVIKLLKDIGIGEDSLQGKEFTHYTYRNPSARWFIRNAQRAAFWLNYCQLVEDCDDNGILGERISNTMPVVFEFTLPKDEEDHYLRLLQRLASYCEKVIIQHFTISSQLSEVLTLVLTSGKEASQFSCRFQFPYCRMEVSQLKQLFFPKLLDYLYEDSFQPHQGWDSIINIKNVGHSLPCYGSVRNVEDERLYLRYIWNPIELNPDDIWPTVNLNEVFDPRNHGDVLDGWISASDIDSKGVDFLLPMFLSINNTNRITYPQVQLLPPLQLISSVHKKKVGIEGLELAETFSLMLSPQRYQYWSFWLDIGKALYSTSTGENEGLKSWIRLSEQATKNSLPQYLKGRTYQQVCEELYPTFSSSYVDIRTLAWYAREDNPDLYGAWHKDWCTETNTKATSNLDVPIAKAAYRAYWLDYVCIEYPWRWMEFRNSCWRETPKGVSLLKRLSGDFVQRFEELRHDLTRQKLAYGIDDDYSKERNALEDKIKNISKLLARLNSVPDKIRILRACAEEFDEPEFVSRLNKNPDLTGVTNGVLEITGNTVVHRRVKPQDYISKNIGIPFLSHFSINHNLVQEVMTWLGQVFTDKALLHHFLKFSSSLLRAKNSDKIFPVMTGEGGDNSKSMIVKLFEATFNEMCVKFPIAMLTERFTSAGGPSPHIARARYARIAFIDEPEDDVVLKKGVIKRYTGGDSFYARLLHDNGGDIAASFVMVLVCNKVPTIVNPDRPTTNRMKIFPYTSTWVENPPQDKEEQYRTRKFKMDKNFEQRISILAPAFLWLLTQYFPFYTDEGLVDPAIIVDSTNKYWLENDFYAQFITDRIEEVNKEDLEKDKGIDLRQLYSDFKLWYQDSFPQTRPPVRGVFRSEMSKKWGYPVEGRWKGYTIRTGMNKPIHTLSATLGISVNEKEEPIKHDGLNRTGRAY